MAGVPGRRFERALRRMLGGEMMEEFIKTLTEQIRCVKARDGVARELSGHILDQAQTYEESGMSHEDALEKAVLEMGDPVEAGVALDRIHRPQTDWKLLLMTFALSIMGFLIMYLVGGLSERYSVSRQFLFTFAGFGVIMGIQFLDYSFIGKYGNIIYIVMTIGLILYGIKAPRVNGRVPALTMPVYLYAPVYAGVLYQSRGKGYAAVIKGTAALLLTAMLAAMLSNSIPAAINLYFICTVMLITAIRRNWFRVNKKFTFAVLAALLFLVPILIVIYTAYFSPGGGYRVMRLRAFLNPEAHRNEAGYLYTVIREYLAGAKFAGAGTAPDFGSVLADTGVFVPLLLIQSYGLLAGYALALALVVFVVRAFHITRCQKNQLGLMVSAACSLVFFLNCCEGLFLNVGMYPLTNIPLPFLTYGGSTTLIYAVLTGLLLSVHRHEKIVTDSTAGNQPRWCLNIRFERRVRE